MGKKRPGPEQIVTLLRQIEVSTSHGKSISIACRVTNISVAKSSSSTGSSSIARP